MLLAAATTVLAAQRLSHSVVKRELEAYEERYIRTQNYQYHNQSVKLIGYQTIKIPAESLDLFEEYYSINAYALQEDFPSHFYDSYAAELRVYFPVASALLDHNEFMVEANHLGEFEHDALDGDYAVLGRKQTSHVHGVANNIIQDGTIFLAKRNHPIRQIDNTRVYDFGRRSLDHHHHFRSPVKKRQYGSAAPEPTAGSGGDTNPNNDDNGENPSAKNNGCAKNHGGENCSKAYGINYDSSTGKYSGSCSSQFDGTTCMDYNGPFSNCNRADRKYFFVGSDCFKSVAMGNCWNEVESAE
ncbi:hypothetical protein N7510_003270 [Penicillium lagena]|uniref:uncharacterized protein n=1 Tax=Penicillium lagena TaxID=94218 RepID=UPI0025413292|nr:uncharacterized protein N7510_003270 [Penicillium lagena]KAJ5619286.1 hypothetical protein N7510_003270 [Penicillium lagena]